VSDAEARKLVEMELRELLNEYGYPGDTAPIIAGSALCALEGKKPEIGENSITQLLDTIDTVFKLPDRNKVDEPLFSAEHVYTIPGRGTVISGKLRRGTLKKGDKVAIVGHGHDHKTTIAGLESFHKTIEVAEPGDQLGILLKGLDPKDVRRGCVLLPQGHKHVITDQVKAQLYLLKPEEGGSKLPVANHFQEHIFSLTWDCNTALKIVGKDFIMPGENGEVILSLGAQLFVEPQQRFTLRKEGTTIATGVFTEVLPARTEEEKSKKYRKQQLKEEMERLGFNPYNKSEERRCKPDYSKSPKDNPIAAQFEEAQQATHA